MTESKGLSPTAHALSNHLHQVYFGGNWTVSHLSEALDDVTWEEAITEIHGLNTIAALAYHMGYFVGVAHRVLAGQALEGNDAVSMNHPPIQNADDWSRFCQALMVDARSFAEHIAQIPDAQLWQDFTHSKYGSYFRNVSGIIEHTHYHLGQLVLIKKLIRAR